LKFFGGAKKIRQKYRVVPRASGDTSPLDPRIAESFRKAGIDPDRFTFRPFEPGEAVLPIADLFTPGGRVEHTFSFATLNGALSAVERIVDEDLAARISKQGARWLVVFDGRADPNVPAADIHQQLAVRILELGAEDRGFSHLTLRANTVASADR
jgi:hypothetical protein